MSDNNMLRQANLSMPHDSPVQVVRVEVQENDTREDAQRFQQYGFAAAPSAGEGLVLEIGGLTIALAFDRLADRPGLELNEVMMWHANGCFVKLDNQRQVYAKADKVIVEAPESEFTGNVTIQGTLHVNDTITSDEDVLIGDLSLKDHAHQNVARGTAKSGGPVNG